MIKGGFIYILTNRWNTVLYIGVTANLEKRIYEHQNGQMAGFTTKYRLQKLIYYEQFDRIEDAIAREKQLKGKSRAKKEDLINLANPNWIEIGPQTPIPENLE